MKKQPQYFYFARKLRLKEKRLGEVRDDIYSYYNNFHNILYSKWDKTEGLRREIIAEIHRFGELLEIANRELRGISAQIRWKDKNRKVRLNQSWENVAKKERIKFQGLKGREVEKRGEKGRKGLTNRLTVI